MSSLEIINLALDLTSAMKKSYNKNNDDEFIITDLNLLTLNLNCCPSMKHLNLKILAEVLKYLCSVVRDMMYHHEETTYINVRRIIMMQKQSHHTVLRRDLKQR